MQAIADLDHSCRPPGIVLVAPPRMLAALRECLHSHLRMPIIAEISKDLTKHPVYEIARQLTAR